MDADMGAYYTWINLNRLIGADRACFLAWFEGHSEAIVVSPSLPRNTTSTMMANISNLLDLAGA